MDITNTKTLVEVAQDSGQEIQRTATISNDGVYRYLLGRRWGAGKLVTYVMLNPSTADATVDDPTIRRCMGFARSWGFGGIRVVNVYALRATRPVHLWEAGDPVGPQNDEYLALILHLAEMNEAPVVAAWGVHAKEARVREIMALPGSERVECLGVTKDGHPRHPLYLKSTAERAPWPLR